MRLFFGLWPSISATERLSGIAQSLARQFSGKPTQPQTIHLTLAFLGDVPEERLLQLEQVARSVYADPFQLDIDHLRYWHHNELLWAGISSHCAALGKLVDDLRSALVDAGFNVANSDRAYTPHISLVRKVPEASMPEPLPSIETISWNCSSFALVRSQRSEAGSSYQSIAEFSLGPLS